MKKLFWGILLIFVSQLSSQSIRYLIITHQNFYDAIQPLAQWKHRKGLATKVVNVPSGVSASAIRDTIRKYQPAFVLLVGDRNFIPLGKYFPNWTFHQSGTWTDQYYADTTDDSQYKDDIFLGRIPCSTVRQCSVMVNKILAYEQGRLKNSDWYIKASGIARDLENSLHDSCYLATIRMVQTLLLENGFSSVDTLFRSLGEDSLTVKDSVTLGRGIVFYRGSALYTTDNWNDPFGVNPEAINNDSMPAIVISPTCRTMYCPTDSELSTAAGFRWLKQGDINNPKGAVAFWGTTTHFYGPADTFPDQQTFWRSAATIRFFQAITNESENILGKAIRKAKDSVLVCCSISTFNHFGYATACSVAYMEWNLLGDPELNIWTAIPKTMTVIHETIINADSQSLTVTVKDSLTQQFISNARVCIAMDSLIYQYGYTDNLGQITFLIHPQNHGILSITVTARNYLPYQKNVTIRFEQDVGCTQIIAPVGGIGIGTIVTPACSVYNYGLTTENYRVRMKIGTFYDDTAWAYNHIAGTYQQILFPAWNAMQVGVLTVSCSTELITDMNRINDLRTDIVICSITVHIINATADSNGLIVPTGEITVEYGQDTTFLIIPNQRYHVVFLIVDGDTVSPETIYTFTNVIEDHNIYAEFATSLYYDLDISDNLENLVANKMSLLGTMGSIQNGYFRMVNPNSIALNVDPDQFGNADFTGFSSRVDTLRYVVTKAERFTDVINTIITPSAAALTLPTNLVSGASYNAQAQVTIPMNILAGTYRGNISITGLPGIPGTPTDSFTLEVVVGAVEDLDIDSVAVHATGAQGTIVTTTSFRVYSTDALNNPDQFDGPGNTTLYGINFIASDLISGTRVIPAANVSFVPALIESIPSGTYRVVYARVNIPLGTYATTYSGLATARNNTGSVSDTTRIFVTVFPYYDIDISDNLENLVNNKMTLTGAMGSIENGYFRMVNPNSIALNVDPDQFGNADFTGFSSRVDTLRYVPTKAEGFTDVINTIIPPNAVSLILPTGLVSGASYNAQTRVTIPMNILAGTYRGNISITGLPGIPGTPTDSFTLEVTVNPLEDLDIDSSAVHVSGNGGTAVNTTSFRVYSTDAENNPDPDDGPGNAILYGINFIAETLKAGNRIILPSCLQFIPTAIDTLYPGTYRSVYARINIPLGCSSATYSGRVTARNNTNTTSDTVRIFLRILMSGIEEKDLEVNSLLKLSFNYIQPNPFKSQVTISYSIPREELVLFEIFDITGKLITTLVNENKRPGKYSIIWKGIDNNQRKVKQGVYFCQLKVGEFTQTKKIVKTD